MQKYCEINCLSKLKNKLLQICYSNLHSTFKAYEYVEKHVAVKASIINERFFRDIEGTFTSYGPFKEISENVVLVLYMLSF